MLIPPVAGRCCFVGLLCSYGLIMPLVPHTAAIAIEPLINRLRSIPESLADFGLLPEFIGRLPVVSVLEELTEDAERSGAVLHLRLGRAD